MRWMKIAFWVAIAVNVGCGPGQKNGGATGTTVPAANPDDLPAIATEVDAVRTAPTEGHDPSAKSPLLDIMLEENLRSAKILSKQATPAFYLGYTVREEKNAVIEAEGGGLITDATNKSRSLDVEVRVGSPIFDNRRRLANDRIGEFAFLAREGRFPFGADPEAVKHALWLETDRKFRESELFLRNLKTQQNLSTAKSDAPDFSFEKKEVFFQPIAELNYDAAAWRERVRLCSKRARKGIATRSGCRVDFSTTTVYFVDSQGSQIQQSWPTARFSVSVGIKADDGMNLSRTEDRFARDADDLPSDAEIDRMIKTATSDLDALHAAPVADPYVGPAILEGRAAAVFFHEVFGHRIEGHRQKDPNFGKTFTSEVGKKIMPEWLSVYDDPTISKLNGLNLNGFYHFDDEGVRAQKASLVEGGVLKGFVQGRTPLEGSPKSNGHGRRDSGLPAVSRQGNLIVEATRSLTKNDLRARLLAEVKKQGKPYGLIFTDISGGFTNTSQFAAQSFKVIPTMAYRLYPDGRQELVRGLDIVGTPLTVLASIRAAGRPIEIFNGMCGAESGWVPVSAAAPSLLLEKIEVERSFKPSNSPPVLHPPSIRQLAGAAPKGTNPQ